MNAKHIYENIDVLFMNLLLNKQAHLAFKKRDYQF